MPKFFEQGGGEVFVSITDTTTREVYSHTHNTCVLVKDWKKAIEKARELIEESYSRSRIESVEMFSTPRLCSECLKHAAQPLVFENAKHITECLCWIQKDSRCNVHKFG